jgi:hypothetical protein
MGVLGVMAACGGLPAVPGKGGPAWFELTSVHFTVWTDTSPQRARELVGEMERLRQLVAGAAFPGGPPNSRSLVIAVRDDSELEATWPAVGRAYAMPAQPPLWQPTIVLSAYSNGRGTEVTLTHELTHLISFAVVRHQPRWLAEGIAQYFETIQWAPDGENVDVGVAPQIRGQVVQLPHLVSISTLFSWNEIRDGMEERSFYSTARVLFTFLINEHRDELLRYLQLMAATGDAAKGPWKEQAARAWTEAFPSLTPAALDGELRQWLVHGRHLVPHVHVQRQDWPVSERALSDADVYAIRAWLYREHDKVHERESVTAALAADPTNVLARLLGADLEGPTPSPTDARAITAAHGDDWRAWWLEAFAISAARGDPAELQTAATKACALIAQNPAVVAPPKLCPTVATP